DPGPLPRGVGVHPARRPVQAQRRRANQATKPPGAVKPAPAHTPSVQKKQKHNTHPNRRSPKNTIKKKKSQTKPER
ncbi:hypothetical protein ACVGXB_17180, partial [Enterobacter intestinihominis]